MTKVKSSLLVVCVVILLGVLAVSPASAVTILYQGWQVDIYLGKPFNSLEFEDPTAVGKWVQSYSVLDWRDADYLAPASYDEWTVSHSGAIHGNVNEIWMRNAGQSISTQTQQPSSVVSVHLIGDNNDGKAEVIVDGITRAILDMGTRSGSQTVLVIVKDLGYALHNIDVLDQGWAPSGMGDDVAVLGACALGWRKWFPHYWYLDCRIRLYPTHTDVTGMDIPVTVPNGWWGGWYWWHHQCCWLRPWLGPVWWWRSNFDWPWPWWRYRLYWSYWPYYRYYRPWWYNWRWQGGPWFWGFKKCLHYRYRPWPSIIYPWRPPTIYWWSYYWDPEGEGHCVEMVTMSDEKDPAGGRIRPVEQEVIENLFVDLHEFAVNGGYDAGSVEGQFTDLEWVHVGIGGSGLQSWLLSQGALPQDVDDFMETEIVQDLINNSEGNQNAQVGLQYAQWQHPEPAVTVSAESIVVTEGPDTYQYEVNVVDPGLMQTVVVMPSSERLDVGAGPGEPVELMFEPAMPGPQDVMVRVEDDDHSEGEEMASIAHYVVPTGGGGTPVGGVVTQVTIQSDDCGGLGISEFDTNTDCKVDFLDFADYANDWLSCTDPKQHMP